MRGIIFVVLYMTSYMLVAAAGLHVWQALEADQSPAGLPIVLLLGVALGLTMSAEAMLRPGASDVYRN